MTNLSHVGASLSQRRGRKKNGVSPSFRRHQSEQLGEFRTFRKFIVLMKQNERANGMTKMFLAKLATYRRGHRRSWAKLMNAFFKLKDLYPYNEILRDTLNFLKFFIKICMKRNETEIVFDCYLRCVKPDQCVNSVISKLSEKIVARSQREHSSAEIRSVFEILTRLKNFVRTCECDDNGGGVEENVEFVNFFENATSRLSLSELISLFYITLNSFHVPMEEDPTEDETRYVTEKQTRDAAENQTRNPVEDRLPFKKRFYPRKNDLI